MTWDTCRWRNRLRCMAVGVVWFAAAAASDASPPSARGPVETTSAPADVVSKDAAPSRAVDAEHLAAAEKLIDSGVRYLLAHVDEDGGWIIGEGANKPAVTAMPRFLRTTTVSGTLSNRDIGSSLRPGRPSDFNMARDSFQ